MLADSNCGWGDIVIIVNTALFFFYHDNYFESRLDFGKKTA